MSDVPEAARVSMSENAKMWASDSVDANSMVGHNHNISLPQPSSPGIIISGSSGQAVSLPNLSGFGSPNVTTVNIQDPTESILRDLRTTVRERQQELKGRLQALSDEYEAMEKDLQNLSQKEQELSKCMEALEPPSTGEVETDLEEIPF